MNFVLDIHNHTTASGHAYSTLAEYAQEAEKKGLSLIAITDHAPAMPGSAHEIHFTNFKVIPRTINGVTVMMGAELNILNMSGEIDMSERTLKLVNPIIASLHPPTYKFSKENMEENEKRIELTEAITNAMNNEYIQIIGHLGDPKFPFELEAVIKKSVQTGTLLEINNSSLHPSSFRYGSRERMLEMLKMCKKYDCPVVCGTDSHFAAALGEFNETLTLLADADFPESLVANVSVNKFLSLLRNNDQNRKEAGNS